MMLGATMRDVRGFADGQLRLVMDKEISSASTSS
jgi:hypothetical protein